MLRSLWMKVRGIAFAVGSLLALAVPGHTQTDTDGVWSGMVQQNDPSPEYEVVVTLSATQATTDYPSLDCSGALLRIGMAGRYTFYAETIVRGRLDQGGRCIDGTLTLAPNDGRLAFGWFGTFEGKVLNAYADLTRRP